jgi:alkylation response protein AidB-like acyl-CoA dehydrogenase
MDLQFDDDQLAFRESFARFLAERYAKDEADARAADPSFSRRFVREAAAMGVIGVAVDDLLGGVGLTTVESLSVHELAGAALVTEPLLACEAAARLIARQALLEQAERLLPGLLDGSEPVALALQEQGTPASDLNAVAATRAIGSGDGYVLDGAKAMVLGAPEAAHLLVSAALPDGQLGIFVVDSDAPGVTLIEFSLVDGRRAADVSLSSVEVPAQARLGAGDAAEALAFTMDYHVLGLCAEMVGVIGAALATTAEYVKVREQFGRPIGAFQAVQHRLADMLVEAEQCTSILYFAMAALESGPAERRAAVQLAKGKIGAGGRFVAGQAVQLHGGIGVTEEYVVGRYLKRMLASDLLGGTSRAHFARRAEAY